MKMERPSFAVTCALCATILLPILFSPCINASIIRTSNHQQSIQQDEKREQKYSGDGDMILPNSFSLIATEDFFPRFENGTSLLAGKMHLRFHRVKRDSCKGVPRPETEVMVYGSLKLANRCWDDCDCRTGRYCTTHNWCHDLTKSS